MVAILCLNRAGEVVIGVLKSNRVRDGEVVVVENPMWTANLGTTKRLAREWLVSQSAL